MKHLKKFNEDKNWVESFDKDDGGLEHRLDEVYNILRDRIESLGIEDFYIAEEMIQDVVMKYLKDKLWNDEELSDYMKKKELGE